MTAWRRHAEDKDKDKELYKERRNKRRRLYREENRARENISQQRNERGKEKKKRPEE